MVLKNIVARLRGFWFCPPLYGLSHIWGRHSGGDKPESKVPRSVCMSKYHFNKYVVLVAGM
jgi:hypothetical protein